MEELRFEEIEQLMGLPTDTYRQRVIALFRTQAATQEQWLVMADAVVHVSQSGDGHLVAAIDRAVLAMEDGGGLHV